MHFCLPRHQQISFDCQLKEASFKAKIEEQHLCPLTLLHSRATAVGLVSLRGQSSAAHRYDHQLRLSPTAVLSPTQPHDYTHSKLDTII